MQLIEVKTDIVKILYNPAENHLLPSDFLLIEDTNQKLIAQIINISTLETSINNLADARFILSIDKEDNLSYYNGYIPLKNSTVVYINSDEIVELIKSNDKNIYLGKLSNHNDCFVKVPLSCFSDRVYIQSDRYDKVKILIQNIVAELVSQKNKVIIFDFNGQYSGAVNTPKLKISESFKLPLNIEAFNNILEYDTSDCPIEDKAVIQSIVLELRDYIKTVDNKFLPFTLFKTVIDNELSSNPISGLLLLRNKLWLYAQEGIFAESKTQFEIINTILKNQNVLIIDASALEEKWYRFTIQTIQNLVKENCYFVMSLSDIDTDRKTITGLYSKPNIIPIVSTTYDSKYRQILKSICKNQILFKPSKLIKDEEAYNCFINRINSSEFILYGESDLYIPLILELQSFNASTPEEVNENEIKKEVDKLFTSKQIIPTTAEIMKTVEAETEITEKIAETATTEVTKEKNEILNEQETEQIKIDDDFNDSDLDFLDEKSVEKLTIDDIKGQKEAKSEENTEEKKYGIFSPVENTEIAKPLPYIDAEFDPSLRIDKKEEETVKFVLPKGVEDSVSVNAKENSKNVENNYAEEIQVNDNSQYDENILMEPVLKVNPDKIIDEEFQLAEPEEIVALSDNNEIKTDETIEKIDSGKSNDNDKAISILFDDEIEENLYDDIETEEISEKEYSQKVHEAENETLHISDTEEKLEPQDKIKVDEEVKETQENTDTEEKLEPQDNIKVDEDIKETPKEIDAEEKLEPQNNVKVDEEVRETQEDTDTEEKLELQDKIKVDEEIKETLQLSEAKMEPEQIDNLKVDDVEIQEEEQNEISVIDDVINVIEQKAQSGELEENSSKKEVSNTDNTEKENIDSILGDIIQLDEEDNKNTDAPAVNTDISVKTKKELPNYEADIYSEQMENEIPFKLGDRVYHPKHGVGTIVGFAQYSNKILFCRIDFDNKGIRILDPRVSGLSKE